MKPACKDCRYWEPWIAGGKPYTVPDVEEGQPDHLLGVCRENSGLNDRRDVDWCARFAAPEESKPAAQSGYQCPKCKEPLIHNYSAVSMNGERVFNCDKCGVAYTESFLKDYYPPYPNVSPGFIPQDYGGEK